MSRALPLRPLWRSFTPIPPRTTPHISFSTTTHLRATKIPATPPSTLAPPPIDPPSTTPPPPVEKPAPVPTQDPSAPEAQSASTPTTDPSTAAAVSPSRLADLAATEAVTESDSAQPAAPKPVLPSKHNVTPLPPTESADTSQKEDAVPTQSRAGAISASSLTPPTRHPDSPSPISPPIQRTLRTRGRRRRDQPVLTSLASSALVQSSLNNGAATTRGKSLTTPTTQTRPLPTTTTTTTAASAPPKLTQGYHISRTRSQNLPIYTDYKRGGNLHLTTIRRISGNPRVLRDELRVLLNQPAGGDANSARINGEGMGVVGLQQKRGWKGKLKEVEVRVNEGTGHVVVKGHVKEVVEEWLVARGF